MFARDESENDELNADERCPWGPDDHIEALRADSARAWPDTSAPNDLLQVFRIARRVSRFVQPHDRSPAGHPLSVG
jgi:hypothetical protein